MYPHIQRIAVSVDAAARTRWRQGAQRWDLSGFYGRDRNFRFLYFHRDYLVSHYLAALQRPMLCIN